MEQNKSIFKKIVDILVWVLIFTLFGIAIVNKPTILLWIGLYVLCQYIVNYLDKNNFTD